MIRFGHGLPLVAVRPGAAGSLHGEHGPLPQSGAEADGLLDDAQRYGQRGRLGGDAVPALVGDHAAHGQAALLLLDRFDAAGILIRALDVLPLSRRGHGLPLVAVRPCAAGSLHGKRGLLSHRGAEADGLLDNAQLHGQQQAHMVVRIRKFLNLRLFAAHIQIQLLERLALRQRRQRNIHGIAEVIAQGLAERMAVQRLPAVSGGQNRGHGGGGIAASVADGDVNIILAAAAHGLRAEHQVVGIGVDSPGGVAAQAHRRRALCRRTHQKQPVLRFPGAQIGFSRHADDSRFERVAAAPVGRNPQLRLIAVRIARHQQAGVQAARRAACGGGAGNPPAFVVQRIVQTADPAQDVFARHRIARALGWIAARAESRMIGVDVQRLHQRVCRRLPDFHIEGGERHVAGVLHGEHQIGIIPGADAGIGEHSCRHPGGSNRPIGEAGKRQPQIGALAALRIHKIVSFAAVVRQPDAAGIRRKLGPAERAIGRVAARVVAHAAHQALRAGGILRGCSLRPVEADAVVKAGDVKERRADFDVVIGSLLSIGRHAPEAMGIAARLRLHALQIEQPVRGRAAEHLEAGDLSPGQHILSALSQAGKLAPGIQGIERGLPVRCRGRRDAVAGNLRVIREGLSQRPVHTCGCGMNDIAPAVDLLRISGCGIAADDADVAALHADASLRQDGIIAVLLKGLLLLIADDIQPFFVVDFHQHIGHAGSIQRGGLSAGAGVGELAAQDRQRAVIPLGLQREVVVCASTSADLYSRVCLSLGQPADFAMNAHAGQVIPHQPRHDL